MTHSLLGRESPVEHLLGYFEGYSGDLMDKVIQIFSVLDFDWEEEAEIPGICSGDLIWDTFEQMTPKEVNRALC